MTLFLVGPTQSKRGLRCYTLLLERWLSGLRRRSRKAVYGNVPRVRIPPSPPLVPVFASGSVSAWTVMNGVRYFCGEVREWLNRHAWKACVPATVPRVRIPPSPPYRYLVKWSDQPVSRILAERDARSRVERSSCAHRIVSR